MIPLVIPPKNNAFTVIIALFIITVLSSIFIAFYYLRRLRKAQSDVKSRMCLIDQNILGKKVDFLIKPREIKYSTSEIQLEDILVTTSTETSWQGELCIQACNNDQKWIHSAVH